MVILLSVPRALVLSLALVASAPSVLLSQASTLPPVYAALPKLSPETRIRVHCCVPKRTIVGRFLRADTSAILLRIGSDTAPVADPVRLDIATITAVEVYVGKRSPLANFGRGAAKWGLITGTAGAVAALASGEAEWVPFVFVFWSVPGAVVGGSVRAARSPEYWRLLK